MGITEVRARAAGTAAPVSSGIAIGGSAVAGASWYVTALLTLCGVVASLMPQQSQHRRDLWRDWLAYRERRYLVRKSYPLHGVRSRTTRVPPGCGGAIERPAGADQDERSSTASLMPGT